MVKSFCRYTATEQPDRLEEVTGILAIRQKKAPGREFGHLSGDEVKALLTEPGTVSTRALRDTALLALAYDTAARVQELCDLNVADIRLSTPITVTIHGKGSKTRYVPSWSQPRGSSPIILTTATHTLASEPTRTRCSMDQTTLGNR